MCLLVKDLQVPAFYYFHTRKALPFFSLASSSCPSVGIPE
jgi:hypothetical protein